LSEIRITPDVRGVLVHEGGNAWNPESGQLQLQFGAGDLTIAAAPLARTLSPRDRESREPQGAWGWFDLAMELENTDPIAASRAYTQALAQDPAFADAHVNLGRLLQLAGQIEEAIHHYHQSIQAASSDPTAAFNLGTALEELGRWNDALAAYRQAIEADRCFADAHFNLARLCEQLGRRAEAIRHLRTYKGLVE
jgi:tetratricopeptide (TPR) repeat protein